MRTIYFKKIFLLSACFLCLTTAFSEPRGGEDGDGSGATRMRRKPNEVSSGETAGDEGRNQGPKKRRPPKEALEACTGKSSGAECSFTSERGQVSGTCWSPKQELPLACKPNRRPGGN